MRVLATNPRIPRERFGKPEADWFENRVEPDRPPLCTGDFERRANGLGAGWVIGNDDDFGGQVEHPVAVRAVPAEDQFRARGNSRFDFLTLKTVDRDAQTSVPQTSHRVANFTPGFAGDAAQVDQVGPLTTQPHRLADEISNCQSRGVIDLGEDLDVVGREVRRWPRPAAKQFGDVLQVFRPQFDRLSPGVSQRFEIALAPAWQEDAGHFVGKDR